MVTKRDRSHIYTLQSLLLLLRVEPKGVQPCACVRGTRVLYLNDSGALALNDASGAVVIEGLAIASARVSSLHGCSTHPATTFFGGPNRRLEGGG